MSQKLRVALLDVSLRSFHRPNSLILVLPLPYLFPLSIEDDEKYIAAAGPERLPWLDYVSLVDLIRERHILYELIDDIKLHATRDWMVREGEKLRHVGVDPGREQLLGSPRYRVSLRIQRLSSILAIFMTLFYRLAFSKREQRPDEEHIRF